MDEIRELYQQVIIDHNRHPRNFCELDNPTCSAEGVNPLCGDQLTLYLQVDDAGVIQKACFKGSGCAISTASASLMTESLQGKTVAQADALFKLFHSLIVDSNSDMDATHHETLGKLAVLVGVKAFPSRVKCATLAWHTLSAALANQDEPVSTE